jgi:hypothetical protein
MGLERKGEAVKTVFMVTFGDNYEGPVWPIRVFSSLEKAKEHAATLLPKWRPGDFLYVEEITLDEACPDTKHLHLVRNHTEPQETTAARAAAWLEAKGAKL